MSKKTLSILLLLAFSISVACADEIRSHQFDTERVRTLHIENSVGTIMIAPSTSEVIEIEIRLSTTKKSGWFRNAPELTALDLTARQRGDRLQLSFRENDVKADWTIQLPESMVIRIEQGVGTVDMTNTNNPITVELGVGAVTIRTSDANTALIELKAGVGDTKVIGGSSGMQSRAFVSSETRSSGHGKHPITVEVGVGDVEVELY